MDKLTIRIHKNKQRNVYPVTVYSGMADSEGISNAVGFRKPLTDTELGVLQAYAETWRIQPEETRDAAVTVNRKFTDWGEKLFDALFTEDVREIYENYCNEQDAPPPTHLWIEAPELWEAPWELLRDSTRKLNVGLTTSITRTMERPISEMETLSEDLPIKVLYIISRPDDAGFVGLSETRAVLKELSGVVHVDLLRPPTYSQFLAQLKRGYHVVHFDGHGDWDSSTQQGVLCFESPPHQGKWKTHNVTAEQIRHDLIDSGVKLVVLAACKSGQPHQVNPYASIAQAALNASVPAVVAMRYSVYVDTAGVFYANFYRALIENRSVEEAVLSARKQVAGRPDAALHDWFVPVLYQRAVSTRLFDGNQGAVELHRAPCTVPELDAAFVGREREVLEVDRALTLDNVSTVTLTGMAGVGKTTLSLALVHWYRAGNAFPGGYFWHSFEVGGSVDAVIDRIGHALMGDAWAPLPPDEKPQIVQKYLAENPSLLVWDNFETVLQDADATTKKGLRHFLKGLPGGSRALATSRRTRVGVTPRTKEKTVELDVLNPTDAEALTWLFGELEDVTDKLHAEREKLPTFLDAVGHHPLGISLAIPQLAFRDWTLTELIRALGGSVDTLALDAELYDDPDMPERLKKVAASFELTYNALSNDARDLLPKLAVTFPGGMWSFTVTKILEMDQAKWDDITKEFNTHNLLSRRPVLLQHLGGVTLVWHLHPLIRAYATAKLEHREAWRRSVAKKWRDIAGGMFSEFERPNA